MGETAKMAMAAKAMADVIDCLNGLISEQGYDGLRSYTNDPERMMAELEGAREFICGYAEDCEHGPSHEIGRGSFAVPGQSGVWKCAVNHAAGKKPSPGKDRA